MNTEGDKRYEKPKIWDGMGIASTWGHSKALVSWGVWRGHSAKVIYGQRIKG